MPARLLLLVAAFGASVARGDVVTSLSGSTLLVEGDGGPDTVFVEPAPGGVAVTGREGTLVDGSSLGTIVSGVTRLKVRLKNGADRLTVTELTFSSGIGVRLGGGNDGVFMDRVSGGATRIRTGDGRDGVRVYGSSRYRHLSVLTGRGPDSVVVDGLWIPGNLYVDTGSDDDDVSLVATQVGNDARVYLGTDEDVLFIADVAVYDDTDIDGNDGEDWLYFAGYVWFEDELDIDGFDDDWWF